ncbi:MAG: 4-aminobutyrate aminotransferase/(S)-3-amino-2-methylpropionate transaminase [Granulosicoccus sp.]
MSSVEKATNNVVLTTADHIKSNSNKDWLAPRMAAVPRGVATGSTAFIDRAENAEIWDVEDRRYIDFGSGIAVSNTGHRHEKVMQAAAPYRPKGTPVLPGTYHAPFPVEHHGVSEQDSLKALNNIFKADMSPDDIAAIVIEPVQGEAGFYQTPKSFMKTLRSICDEQGICLVADEVQAGFARTGKVFAIEHYDIEPDLIPIACAAALAVLDVIEQEQLCERAIRIGAHMVETLERIKTKNTSRPIGDIRGLGAMVAFELVTELVTERGTDHPHPDAVKAVTARAAEPGLVLLSCGYWGNTIRLLAPLTIPEDPLIEGLNMLEAALENPHA